MSTTLTILLLSLAGSGGDDPFTPAVASATRQAFGPDANVVLESVAALPSDDAAVALGAQAHADVIVEVAWKMPEHLGVTIRLERSSSGRWVEREIGFQPADEPLERSRTVAFTIASMLPEYFLQPQPPASQAPPTLSTAAPARAVPKERAAERRGGLNHRATLSGAADAAFGVRDHGTSIGGVLDFRYRLGARVSFRVGGSARVGQDTPAQAVTRFFNGGLGLTWNAWVAGDASAALGLRLDALAMAAVFSRISADAATTVYRTKWLPGADLMMEGCYFFTDGAAVVLAGGAEATLGTTDVVVEGRRVDTYEPIHPVVELGLRAGF